MLKQRIVTAVLLAAFVLWALYGWPHQFFGWFLLFATGVCAWEWSQLGQLQLLLHRLVYVIAVTAVTAVILFFDSDFLLKILVVLAMAVWLYVVVDLKRRPVLDSTDSPNWGLLALAAFLLIVAVSSVYASLVRHSPTYVVFIIAIVAAADIGAYFSGRRFGRRKLAVKISQGKTIEGAVGGLAAASLLTLIVMFVTDFIEPSGILLFITLMAVLLSIAGDLFISRAKRTAGVKDSGKLLPGHGGVLDRVDGLLAAAPWLTFPLLWSV